MWVIEIPGGSKRLALLAGDAAAAGYPRIYVDADVEFRATDLLALSRELAKPGVLAAVPERMLALDGRGSTKMSPSNSRTAPGPA